MSISRRVNSRDTVRSGGEVGGEGDSPIDGQMDQPSTSAEKKKSWRNPKRYGVETSDLLHRIRLKVVEEQASTKEIPLSDPVGRTVIYTGLHRTNIEHMLAQGDSLEYEIKDIDRQLIQKELVRIYLCNNQIPSIDEFYDVLHEKLPIYVDIAYFTKLLIKMGYAFYKFPGIKTLHVMEKKSVTFERYKYLKSIQRYREENIPIVYIGFAAISDTGVINLELALKTEPNKVQKYILFTATDQHGIDHIKAYYGFNRMSKESIRNNINEWFFKIICKQYFPPRSVYIFEDLKIFKEMEKDIPTWKSVKADMVEWLEEHNIPCDINMPQSELLELIETCTDTKKNIYEMDNLLKIHNYSLMRLPKCINGLSIATLVVRDLISEDNLSNFSEPLLRQFSQSIKIAERQQIEDDIKVDDALDELVRKMKTSEPVINVEFKNDLLI